VIDPFVNTLVHSKSQRTISADPVNGNSTEEISADLSPSETTSGFQEKEESFDSNRESNFNPFSESTVARLPSSISRTDTRKLISIYGEDQNHREDLIFPVVLSFCHLNIRYQTPRYEKNISS
jgi:hypothetical protein